MEMGYIKSWSSTFKFLSLLILFLLIILIGFLYYFEYSEELLDLPGKINEQIEGLGVLAPVVFILLYIPVVLFFIPAWPLSLAGGMLFGMPLAPVYVIIGAGLGGLAAFSIARYFENGKLSSFIENRSKRYYEYYRLIDRYGISFVVFLHFALVIPFAGINYLLGMTKISFKSFIIGTFIGLVPGSIFYTYFGFVILEWSIVHFIVVSFILIGMLLFAFMLRNSFDR